MFLFTKELDSEINSSNEADAIDIRKNINTVYVVNRNSYIVSIIFMGK
jgi:hypothetical protein